MPCKKRGASLLSDRIEYYRREQNRTEGTYNDYPVHLLDQEQDVASNILCRLTTWVKIFQNYTTDLKAQVTLTFRTKAAPVVFVRNYSLLAIHSFFLS